MAVDLYFTQIFWVCMFQMWLRLFKHNGIITTLEAYAKSIYGKLAETWQLSSIKREAVQKVEQNIFTTCFTVYFILGCLACTVIYSAIQ